MRGVERSENDATVAARMHLLRHGALFAIGVIAKPASDVSSLIQARTIPWLSELEDDTSVAVNV